MSKIERLDIVIFVNGDRRELSVEPRLSLADAIREECGLTGTHIGCEYGSCGTCTVIVDGDPVRSCLMLAVQADGAHIETVESLAAGGVLSPLQQAFHRNHALQCGYCTPGFLMLATAFLRENPRPTESEIREMIASNLCRCTGYENIVAAVRDASGMIADGHR